MILTKKQEEGLKIALERYKNGEKYTVIAGYAGTGKSTLVRFIIEALQIDPQAVCYATFTGKAAEVLRKKGNNNTLTLHKLLYENIMLPNGEYLHIPKKVLGFKIIVVDEISMVPKQMIELLFSHNCYVICLGDPFQLPPIDKNADNHLLDNPHVFLYEIVRQAEESEIIRISMDIREQRNILNFDGNDIKVLPQHKYQRDMLLWADQILVGTNNSRVNCNNTIRKMLGKGELPEDGDKVVCLRNYWETFTYDGQDVLVNGTIGYLSNPIHYVSVKIPTWLHIQNNPILLLETDIITEENNTFYDIFIDQQYLMTEVNTLSQPDLYKMYIHKNNHKNIANLIPKEFGYGYAITCHKAQGSQWPKVFILEEKFPYQSTEHARWLYTAITRAEEKVILVRE